MSIPPIPVPPLTDALYWASKSPTILAMVSAIQKAATSGQGWTADQIATATGQALATMGKTSQGDLIDVPIMVWGWDPTITMQIRLQFGYAWVPSALTPPVEFAPGLVVPGMPSYNPADPPPLGIKVSVLASDYPAYAA